MQGEEPSLGVLRPFEQAPAPAPVYTPDQLKAIATAGLDDDDEKGNSEKALTAQSLAQTEGEEGEAGGDVSKEAVIAAAQKEGASVHKDDSYMLVQNAPGPRYPPTHEGQDLDVVQFGDYPADYGSHTAKRLRSQDTIVPVNRVQMSMYPVLNLQDSRGVSDHETGEPGKPVTANLLFGKALHENGLGDGKYVETVAGGVGMNSEPPIDRVYDVLTADDQEDDGSLSKVMLWMCGLLVFVGAIVLLGYNLLPPGSFSRAWRGDDGMTGDEEDGKWTRAYYAPATQGPGYAAQMRQV